MTPELVEVTWRDTHSQGAWENLKDLTRRMSEQPLLCASLGYLVLDVPDRLVIVQSISWDDAAQESLELADSALVIPRSALVSITKLSRED